MKLSFDVKKKEKKKGEGESTEEFFFEEKPKDDPIVLTIDNEDNFEDLVIKAEIKREIYSFRFFLMIITILILLTSPDCTEFYIFSNILLNKFGICLFYKFPYRLYFKIANWESLEIWLFIN